MTQLRWCAPMDLLRLAEANGLRLRASSHRVGIELIKIVFESPVARCSGTPKSIGSRVTQDITGCISVVALGGRSRPSAQSCIPV
jgi:hypothetical protein